MTGWCVTDAPCSDATIYALKKGCERFGVPKAIYTDNGREFLFHDLGGNGFRKKRKEREELKLPSILDDLGIENSMTRTTDETLGPSVRPERAQSFYGNGKDIIVLSNHINAGGHTWLSHGLNL